MRARFALRSRRSLHTFRYRSDIGNTQLCNSICICGACPLGVNQLHHVSPVRFGLKSSNDIRSALGNSDIHRAVNNGLSLLAFDIDAASLEHTDRLVRIIHPDILFHVSRRSLDLTARYSDKLVRSRTSSHRQYRSVLSTDQRHTKSDRIISSQCSCGHNHVRLSRIRSRKTVCH